MPLLLVWAVPGVLGLVLALTLGRTWGRIGALVVMGLVLGLAWLAVAYFAATPSDQPRDCSDCYESFGRWWEPNWALFVIGVSCALWALGVLVGAALRRGRAPPHPDTALRERADLRCRGRTRTLWAVALPVTQYARSGDVNIAYQVVGDGALDLVWIPSMAHHVELAWESPAHARFLNRLASISRLIVFDKRGTGMSDRLVGGETLEARMDDIRMVMDAAGSERAVLFGLGDGGPLCVLFAATYPDRTSGLVLMHSTPRLVRAPGLPWLPSRSDIEKSVEKIARGWGDPAFYEQRMLRRDDQSWTEEERRAYIRVLRLSVSPGAVAAYMRANLDVDVRDVLPLIRMPTLVLQRTEIPGMDVRRGRYLADHISSARLVELPGHNFEPLVGDQERLFSELEAFLANVREGGELVAERDRVLATVLFTDIVDATARAADLGDRAWRKLLEDHHNIVRGQLSRFRGREMDTAGDGFFATFDGPARGIHCACAIRKSVRELGLEIRAGLHTGECELVDGKAGGIAVHIGARVASHAASNDVLVSSTVKDLVAGSGIDFEDRGPHELKGIPGEWRLYAVAKEG